ncbi:protein D3-like isoform X1 [Dermacentor albipictus]|uniref:protein D3-like isoform X1 n=1 Tax=Dermacentor albipictus TaxID=60249 RepID=UPI0038FC5BB7
MTSNVFVFACLQVPFLVAATNASAIATHCKQERQPNHLDLLQTQLLGTCDGDTYIRSIHQSSTTKSRTDPYLNKPLDPPGLSCGHGTHASMTSNVFVFACLQVDMGNELEPTSVAEPPDVVLRGRSDYFYALCMVDLDAPSSRAPKHRAWLHWLVVNIPAQRLDAGKVLATYSPPTPATSTGSHRFVFIQFEQPDYFFQGNFIFIPMRAAFNVGAFMADNNIRRIVAFNFFRIETEYRNLL